MLYLEIRWLITRMLIWQLTKHVRMLYCKVASRSALSLSMHAVLYKLRIPHLCWLNPVYYKCLLEPFCRKYQAKIRKLESRNDATKNAFKKATLFWNFFHFQRMFHSSIGRSLIFFFSWSFEGIRTCQEKKAYQKFQGKYALAFFRV